MPRFVARGLSLPSPGLHLGFGRRQVDAAAARTYRTHGPTLPFPLALACNGPLTCRRRCGGPGDAYVRVLAGLFSATSPLRFFHV
jgi:hypothetical protein